MIDYFLRPSILLVVIIMAVSIVAQADDSPVEGLNKLNHKLIDGGLYVGEYIDARTGSYYWETTDLVLPGNGGLDIEVMRSFGKSSNGQQLALGTWELEVPRIEINTNPAGYTLGGYPPTGNGICLNPSSGSFVSFYLAISGGYYWSGLKLIIPGEAPKELLLSTDQYAFGTYSTVDNWKIECLDINGRYDGFLVYSPNGEKYYLDKIARQHGDLITGLYPGLTRIYAGKKVDRFDNTLTYIYDQWRGTNGGAAKLAIPERPYLKRIEASDGRVVEFFYTGTRPLLERFTVNGQTWQFSYNGNRWLKTVTRPDNATWLYNYGGPKIGGLFADNYVLYPELPFNLLSSITTPEGANITYNTFASHQELFFGGSTRTSQVRGIGSRTMSGSSIQTENRIYSYTNSATLNTTTITGPYGTEVYEFHRNSWQHGLLKSKRIIDDNGIQQRNETYTWGKLTQRGDNYVRERPESVVYPRFMTEKIVDSKYRTIFRNHDEFGNPQEIEEIGTDPANPRITQLSYYNMYTWASINGGRPQFKYINIGLPMVENIVGEGKISREYSAGILRSINKYGIKESYEYNEDGTLKKRRWTKDGITLFTEYQNYYRGKARKEIRQEGVVIDREINPTGTIQWEKDGNGYTTSYEYDALNRLKRIIPPIHAATTINWSDPRTRVLTRGDYQETTFHDNLMRPVLVHQRDTLLNKNIYTRKEYDALGRLSFKSFPSESSAETRGTRTQYDLLDRPLSATNTADNSVTTFCYDLLCGDSRLSHGSIVSTPEGYETLYEQQSYGNPDEQDLIKITALEKKAAENGGTPKYVVTDIVRNKLGKIRYVTQGGYTREYIYHTNSLLLWKIINPETGVTEFTYDEIGNKKTQTVGSGGLIQFGYDNLNQLKLIDYPNDTPDVSYVYDKNGNLDILDNGDTSWDYDYNELNLITDESLRITRLKNLATSFINLKVSYGYNSLDAITSIMYPEGEQIQLQPDAFGRPTQVGSYAAFIDYYPNDQYKTLVFGNAQVQTVSQNSKSLPETITTTLTDTNIVNLTYGYDKVGNIKSITDGIVSGTTNNRTLGYDGIARLTSANGYWGNGTISYDDAGNIQTKNMGGMSLTYLYDANNILTGITGSAQYSFSYDDYGNVIANGNDSFVYDDASNLREVTGATNISYLYDGNNHRTVKKVGSNDTYSMYDRDGLLLYTRDVISKNIENYYYLNGKLIAQRGNRCVNVETDTDGDGIPDCIEINENMNPFDPADALLDFDNDELTNLDEYLNGTAMYNPDTDGDGIMDGYEVLYSLNPLFNDAILDPDNDSLSNLDEFFAKTDPNNPDTDGDTMPDGYEVQYTLNPLVDDSQLDLDGDGFRNIIEYKTATIPNDPYSNPAGTESWTLSTSAIFPGIEFSPALGIDGSIYVTNDSLAGQPMLYAISAEGTAKWIYNAPIDTNNISTPAVGADGTIYMGVKGASSTDSALYAVNPDGTIKVTIQRISSQNKKIP